MNEFGEYWARSPHLLYVQEYRYQDIKMKKLEIGKVTETQILETFLSFYSLIIISPVVYLSTRSIDKNFKGVNEEYETCIICVLPNCILFSYMYFLLEL